MSFTPSPYQKAVFVGVRDGEESLIVEAVAGSGKTTTIVGAVRLIDKSKTIMFCAFNKSIAMELTAKLPDHVNCCTMNSLGHRAWMRYVNSRLKLNTSKTYDILDSSQIVELYGKSEVRSVRYVVNQLVAFAKQAGIVPEGIAGANGLVDDTDKNWLDIIDHYHIDMNVKREGKTGFEIREETKRKTNLAVELARKVLSISIRTTTEIDFNDQLYLPVVYGAQFPKNDVVFVDEAQDISHIQRVMLRRALKKNGRIIAVGDPCQPTGTMVTMVENKKGKFNGGDLIQKPIEDIHVGDLVVTYDMQQGQFVRGREIKGITKREYEGVMVDITTEHGLSSQYTPNHHCIASFERLRGKYALYLMSKDHDINDSINYRIGVCKMDYGHSGSGLSARFRAEGADKCWILGLFDYRNDALFHEALVSHNYQIPMLRFKDNSKSATFPQNVLDDFWININDMTDLGRLCILSHGKSPQYPLFTRTDGYKTLKRPIKVRAINLESGCMVLPYNGNRVSYKKDYEMIEVNRSQYSGYVYSMDIDKEHTYIGDGIATHNCQAIYGFRGADSQSLNNIASEFNAKSLPLSISYRCAKEVVKKAQKYVSHIEAFDGAPEGKVEQLGTYTPTTMDTFQPDDFVLCRNVAPLIKLAFALISAKKAVTILGKDIGKNIASLIEKLSAKDIQDLRKKLMKWEKEETNRLLERDPEASCEFIEQRADSVRTFINCSGADTIKGVLDSIDELFSVKSKDAVKLSTIHKSKGLEAERVIILDQHLMPSKYAVKEWQKEQENNLMYVAITRSINYLGYIESPDAKKPKEF